MRILGKLFGLAFFLAVLVLGIYLLWGASFEQWLHLDGLREGWAPFRGVAWMGACALLMTDVLLPIPATVVLSALGTVYGLTLGTAIATLGLVLAGCVGYGIGKLAGPRTMQRLATPDEIEQARRTFNRWGGWAVVLSRSMPILPEIISLMAGLTGMQFRRFLAALFLGSLPTAFLFAYIGVYALEAPGWGLALSLGVPALLWGLAISIGGSSSRLT